MSANAPLPLDRYSSKPKTYFQGARQDYVEILSIGPDARILEIGCGTGDTGAAALAAKRCGWYCGVELSEQAANVAQEQLSEVIVGDIETIDLPWPEQHFDALIMSEVLEHLVDPWRVLRKVRPLMRDGAIVLASSPNVSHHRVIRMLLNGRWDLVEAGTMDRTHLRWFTPNSYAAMFEECGYKVEEMTPLRAFGWRAKLVNVLTLGKLRHLFVVQINVRCRCC